MLALLHKFWIGAGVVERAGLEIRCTVLPYRGFKSHPIRQKQKNRIVAVFFYLPDGLRTRIKNLNV